MKKGVLVLGFVALAAVSSASKYRNSFVLQAAHLNFNVKYKVIKGKENHGGLELNAHISFWLIMLICWSKT
jgi:hypothetical protein